MTTELALTKDKISLVKQTILPEGSTDAELELFIHFAKRTGLDPLARQIYAMKIKGKFSILTSIDGFRLIAERSGHYAGQTIPMYYNGADNQWSEVWTSPGYPAACKIGVHRTDFVEPMFAVAHWTAYAQRKADGNYSYAWVNMPTVMLAKCAEALALRKAFPHELSGLYTSDELSEDKIHEVTVAPETKSKTYIEKKVNPLPVPIPNKEQVILKGTYYPEKPKKQTDPEKQAYIDKLTSAKDLIELQSLIAEVKAEWNTEQFKAYVKTLEHKLRAGFEEEMKEIFTAEEVKPETVQKKGVKK